MASDTPDLVARVTARLEHDTLGKTHDGTDAGTAHWWTRQKADDVLALLARIEALQAEVRKLRIVAAAPEWEMSAQDEQEKRVAAEASRDQALADLDRCKGALEQMAKPYFWQEDGFWPDASTPAHKEQELYRRLAVARGTLASVDRGVE